MRRSSLLLVGVLGTVVAVPTAVVAFVLLQPTANEAEADRIAAVVADAISYPRQVSADGYLAAALATRAGRDGRLVVVRSTPLDGPAPDYPLAELLFRVHVARSEGEFSTVAAVTRCYRTRFGRYGAIGEPARTSCPAGATPLSPPAVAPSPLEPDAGG